MREQILKDVLEDNTSRPGSYTYDTWGNKKRADTYLELNKIYDKGFNSIKIGDNIFNIVFYKESGIGMGASPDTIVVTKLKIYEL